MAAQLSVFKHNFLRVSHYNLCQKVMLLPQIVGMSFSRITLKVLDDFCKWQDFEQGAID